MKEEQILRELFAQRDEKYAALQKKIIPHIDESRIIGVRTPQLRSFAKKLVKQDDTNRFLLSLPHPYFDEDQLHAFIISEIRDFDRCIFYVQAFLPYVNNWATCDQLSPVIFKKNHEKLLPYLDQWIASRKTYTVRFAIGMYMAHFLDADFDIAYAEKIAEIQSDEYYVNMMRAWYFATALAKQYDAVIGFLTENRLDVWTHNKTIQKCVESYRIPDERKEYLKTLRIKAETRKTRS